MGRVAVVLAASLCASCTPASEPAGLDVDGRYVAVPARPAFDAWRLDAGPLDTAACTACATSTGGPSRFFYGTEPLAAVDRMAVGAPTEHDLATMATSGYFGGIYLRGALSGADAAAPTQLLAPALRQVDATVTRTATHLLAAADGDAAAVRAASRRWLTVATAVLGYNLGYLEVALANPPAGSEGTPGADDSFQCTSPLACHSSALPLAALDDMDDVREQLDARRTAQWRAAGSEIDVVLAGTRPAGATVWNRILSGSDFSTTAYESIVDLSVGFLEVTQLAVLGLAAGTTLPAGSQPADAQLIGRAATGLRAMAALVIWSGSYFGGLASPLPNSVLPQLRCG